MKRFSFVACLIFALGTYFSACEMNDAPQHPGALATASYAFAPLSGGQTLIYDVDIYENGTMSVTWVYEFDEPIDSLIDYRGLMYWDVANCDSAQNYEFGSYHCCVVDTAINGDTFAVEYLVSWDENLEEGDHFFITLVTWARTVDRSPLYIQALYECNAHQIPTWGQGGGKWDPDPDPVAPGDTIVFGGDNYVVLWVRQHPRFDGLYRYMTRGVESGDTRLFFCDDATTKPEPPPPGALYVAPDTAGAHPAWGWYERYGIRYRVPVEYLPDSVTPRSGAEWVRAFSDSVDGGPVIVVGDPPRDTKREKKRD